MSEALAPVISSSLPVATRPELWTHSTLKQTLQSISDGLAEVAGFGTVAVSLFRDSDELEFLVVSGSERTRQELIGDITPTSVVLSMLEWAEGWGSLRFLPHAATVTLREHIWVGRSETRDHRDAWQPYDLLMAPLIDADGALQGILWLDLPLDGLRPGRDRRVRVEAYADQAARSVLDALDRARLEERVRLAEAARRVVRSAATAQLDLAHMLEACGAALREGFWVDDVQILIDTDAPVPGAGSPDLPQLVSRTSQRAARNCWTQQRVAIVSEQRRASAVLAPEDHRIFMAGLAAQGDASVMLIPLGAGPECLGRIVLFRTDPSRDWSDEEASTALDIGHDLGRAVLNARSFERERRLVTYKRQLIATMAHELKNPIGAIQGHLEMLADTLDERPDLDLPAPSLRGIGRATERLDTIVGDLLVLSQAEDPGYTVTNTPVDLIRVVRESVELLEPQAARRGIEITAVLPSGEVVVSGDPGELDRVVTNLLSNAVKYSHDDGLVRLSVTRSEGEVTVEVTDHGLGISDADQEQLFQEFFRSSNPEAAAQPGTGLGLAIAARIAVRHLGRIEVVSTLGEGSTFTLRLPLPLS